MLVEIKYYDKIKSIYGSNGYKKTGKKSRFWEVSSLVRESVKGQIFVMDDLDQAYRTVIGMHGKKIRNTNVMRLSIIAN